MALEATEADVQSVDAEALCAADEAQLVVEVEVYSVEAEVLFEEAETKFVEAVLPFVEAEAQAVEAVAEMLIVETVAVSVGATAGWKVYSLWLPNNHMKQGVKLMSLENKCFKMVGIRP